MSKVTYMNATTAATPSANRAANVHREAHGRVVADRSHYLPRAAVLDGLPESERLKFFEDRRGQLEAEVGRVVLASPVGRRKFLKAARTRMRRLERMAQSYGYWLPKPAPQELSDKHREIYVKLREIMVDAAARVDELPQRVSDESLQGVRLIAKDWFFDRLESYYDFCHLEPQAFDAAAREKLARDLIQMCGAVRNIPASVDDAFHCDMIAQIIGVETPAAQKWARDGGRLNEGAQLVAEAVNQKFGFGFVAAV